MKLVEKIKEILHRHDPFVPNWWEQPGIVLTPQEQRHLDVLGYLPPRENKPL